MTADLTPAQAARLEAIERVARAMFQRRRAFDNAWSDVSESTRDYWRAEADAVLSDAAIDVMRGAADDGAVGRVLALADEWDSLSSKHYAILADRIRAAVGAPATAGAAMRFRKRRKIKLTVLKDGEQVGYATAVYRSGDSLELKHTQTLQVGGSTMERTVLFTLIFD